MVKKHFEYLLVINIQLERTKVKTELEARNCAESKMWRGFYVGERMSDG